MDEGASGNCGTITVPDAFSIDTLLLRAATTSFSVLLLTSGWAISVGLLLIDVSVLFRGSAEFVLDFWLDLPGFLVLCDVVGLSAVLRPAKRGLKLEYWIVQRIYRRIGKRGLIANYRFLLALSFFLADFCSGVDNRTVTGSYERFKILLIRPNMLSTKRLYL